MFLLLLLFWGTLFPALTWRVCPARSNTFVVTNVVPWFCTDCKPVQFFSLVSLDFHLFLSFLSLSLSLYIYIYIYTHPSLLSPVSHCALCTSRMCIPCVITTLSTSPSSCLRGDHATRELNSYTRMQQDVWYWSALLVKHGSSSKPPIQVLHSSAPVLLLDRSVPTSLPNLSNKGYTFRAPNMAMCSSKGPDNLSCFASLSSLICARAGEPRHCQSVPVLFPCTLPSTSVFLLCHPLSVRCSLCIYLLCLSTQQVLSAGAGGSMSIWSVPPSHGLFLVLSYIQLGRASAVQRRRPADLRAHGQH